jgi:hypothetical protein
MRLPWGNPVVQRHKTGYDKASRLVLALQRLNLGGMFADTENENSALEGIQIGKSQIDPANAHVYAAVTN